MLALGREVGHTLDVTQRKRRIDNVRAIAFALDLAGLLLVYPWHNRTGWLLIGAGTITFLVTYQIRRVLEYRDRSRRPRTQIRSTTLVAREQPTAD